jgi:hypothetical protein
MTWYPFGPAFVFNPRNPNFNRLSRRNEYGSQSKVVGITVDPSDPATIYIATNPDSGGTASFRTNDRGESWTPMTDELQRGDPDIHPWTFVVHPSNPQVVYLGTDNKKNAVYRSTDQGRTWGGESHVGGWVRSLIIDPRTAANPATTVIWAVTDTGVYRSSDGGSSWPQPPVVAGDVWTLVCDMPANGPDNYYAGVRGSGVVHATSASGTWTNLNSLGIGLPNPDSSTAFILGLCPRNPARIYALTVGNDSLGNVVTTGLFTTSSGTTAWSKVDMGPSPPQPFMGGMDLAFAVAPNSPGDGMNDILFFGGEQVSRSKTSGRTWGGDAVLTHVDQHCFEFFPPWFSPAWTSAGAGSIVPFTYVGCDGALAASDLVASPSIDTNVAPADFSEGMTYTDSWAWQNYNHGLPSVACYAFSSDPGIASLGYLASQDTGLAAGTGGTVWRSLADFDHLEIAAVRGTDAMHVWTKHGQYFDSWPEYRLTAYKDNGDYRALAIVDATLGAGGSFMWVQSPLVVGPDGNCLAGVTVRDSAERNVVARIDADGIGVQISQDFGQNGLFVPMVTPSPVDPNTIYCVTSDGRLWLTNAAGGASSSTVWAEIANARPNGASISSLAFDRNGTLVVLLSLPVTAGVTTPLFQISYGVSGAWSPLTCVNLPSLKPSDTFGKLVADPATPTLTLTSNLYVSVSTNVYEVTSTTAGWNWVDITENLPGGPINDLWCGSIAGAASPTILLRAAIPTRGVFERDVTAGAGTPIGLYVRKNIADHGWLNPSPDGVPDPFHPGTATLSHYMSPDIRIDVRQLGLLAPFFQTEPEASTPPLSPVRFEQLNDNSAGVLPLWSAMVHVQVHNRSLAAAQDVNVWAIYAPVTGEPPLLSASPSMANAFPFWSQFPPSGQITPRLPLDSPWWSVGPPQQLSGIDASHPRVASWLWTVPLLGPGDYRMVVFVHSAGSPIRETRMDLEVITPVNPQISQRSMHVLAGGGCLGAPLAAIRGLFGQRSTRTKGRALSRSK